MSNIKIGDTVAFRRDVASRCDSPAVAAFRAVVTDIAEGWLFLKEPSGSPKVMPADSMIKVYAGRMTLEVTR